MSSLSSWLLTERWQKMTTMIHVPDVRKDVDELICLIFPQRGKQKKILDYELEEKITTLKGRFSEYIAAIDALSPDIASRSKEIAHNFIESLPEIAQKLDLDAKAAFQGDPAAYSVEEVIVTYPGFYAICIYRLSNALQNLLVPLIPRLMSEYAHEKTGIDIHPGAQIGDSFFIDHGTGVVIGETSVIGKNVKIYQGVTLGALSVKKRLQNRKRHPTIEDDVVIYANSTILGGETVVGKGSMIGGNVWLTSSVPENSVVFNKQDSLTEIQGKV